MKINLKTNHVTRTADPRCKASFISIREKLPCKLQSLHVHQSGLEHLPNAVNVNVKIIPAKTFKFDWL